ncbi:hypothetical protein [Lentisalinibacter sediminis]|uniref:hypothetical protein n=1 Tax=Lentisalinibacter sediminis TaxID=2992237 RepID=UPI0038706524
MRDALATADLHKIQQTVKWIVYSLLLANFGVYIYEDVDRALHTLTGASTLLDWTGEFATTLDTAAWLVLLAMFEIETYTLEDRQWRAWIGKTVHGVRILCYAMIAHTVFAYGVTAVDYSATRPVVNATSLCDLAGNNLTFVYNLEYTAVTDENCATLSDASAFYYLGDNPLVSSEAGLELERRLAWGDVIEAITWLVIIFAIEIVVRQQGRGVTGGVLMTSAKTLKLLGYAILFVLAGWWAYLGHWIYTWDTFVWIAGFAVIEMNVHEWRDELLDEREQAA